MPDHYGDHEKTEKKVKPLVYHRPTVESQRMVKPLPKKNGEMLMRVEKKQVVRPFKRSTTEGEGVPFPKEEKPNMTVRMSKKTRIVK